MMKVKTQPKDIVRPLRSGSKVQSSMKFPGPPPDKLPKVAPPVEDLSLLKRSVDTSITNPLEILKVFQDATPEVMETMKNECSLIYECKVCRNLFRSLANFIMHKRNYCTTKFVSSQHESSSNGDSLEHSLIVGGLRGTVSSSRKTTRRDILSLLDNIQERIPESRQEPHIFTEMPHTAAAVFSSSHPCEGDSSKYTMVLGPSGHIVGSTQDGGVTTECKSCGETVSHMETHLSTCNSVFKQCFGCPLCDKILNRPWAVYRHLKKVHGKNSEQVRKMRCLIRKQEIPVETKLKKQSIAGNCNNPSSSEKGWLEELEKNGVDGLYKCYICGKQFERRVALLSHTQACEKRKPGDPRRPQPSSRDHLDKPAPAAIQMRVCYKKDGLLADKLTDCRVVATRLSDEFALAALSPRTKDTDSTHNTDKAALSIVTDASTEDLSQNDHSNDGTMDNHLMGDLENDIQDSALFSSYNEMEVNDRTEDCAKDEESYQLNGEAPQFRGGSQDMFASQTDFNRFEAVPPSTGTSSEVPPIEPLTLSNGFLSSSPEHCKGPNSPFICPSKEKPCNGWKDPGANPVKDNFYSVFVESTESTDVEPNDNQESFDNSMSNCDDDEMGDVDLNTLEITRIICGSVKPERRVSIELRLDDSSSDKHTPSVSTEMSFDFDGEDNDLDSSDSESVDLGFTHDPYISKTDSVCLLCYEKMDDTRVCVNHVARHLGVSRYACGVPMCSTQSYSRSDLMEHIRSAHMLESPSLVKPLKQEQMFSDAAPDFQGFSFCGDAVLSAYSEFFGVLINRHGITFSKDH